jgi:hypothetical protein
VRRDELHRLLEARGPETGAQVGVAIQKDARRGSKTRRIQLA